MLVTNLGKCVIILMRAILIFIHHFNLFSVVNRPTGPTKLSESVYRDISIIWSVGLADITTSIRQPDYRDNIG